VLRDIGDGVVIGKVAVFWWQRVCVDCALTTFTEKRTLFLYR